MSAGPDTDHPLEAEEALARSRRELDVLQARFDGIVERTADGIMVVGDDGEILFANPAAERLFGRSAERLLGSPFGYPLVPGENTEIDVVRNGDAVVAELRVTATEWDGAPAQIVSLRDVTDRKKAEKRLRQLSAEKAAREEAEEARRGAEFLAEASRRLSTSLDLESTLHNVVRLMVDRLADLCVLDLAAAEDEPRRFLAAGESPALREAMDVLRRGPVALDADTPLGRVYRKREGALLRPVPEEWLSALSGDGGRLEVSRRLPEASAIVVPIHTAGKSLGVMMALCIDPERDFTLRHFHLAEELARRAALAIENARLYQRAEAANRAKTNFLSVMSHELRTPLSGIIGYADLIDRGVAGEVTEKQSHFLGRIRASSSHLLQIIEEILAFASSEAGEQHVNLEATTLDGLLEAVRAVAEPLSRDAGLELRVEIADGDAPLRTDIRKARQILLNLVSNAFKFTREGHVALRARVEDDDAVFEVEDTGVGIPEDRLENIFERFWQVEDPMTRKAGGTGLGLAIARSFSRLLGGEVSVVSEHGHGSTFTVRLPRSPSA